MNKFDLMNTVTISNLKPENKLLLIELILRADETWVCWPSVERLCKVRGIKHEKNFKGVEHYLPGLVTKEKLAGNARKNLYRLDHLAISELPSSTVTIKHTPVLARASFEAAATTGENIPAGSASSPGAADITPAGTDKNPAARGANSTSNTSLSTSLKSSEDKTVVRLGKKENSIWGEEDLVEASFPSNPKSESIGNRVSRSSMTPVIDADVAKQQNYPEVDLDRILGYPSFKTWQRTYFPDVGDVEVMARFRLYNDRVTELMEARSTKLEMSKRSASHEAMRH